MGVSLVVFDLGGVVVRICRSWQEGCAAAGLDVRGTERMRSDGRMTARRELVKAYQEGRMTCDEYCAAVAGATEGQYSPDEVRRIHNAWVLEEYPGVGRLVGDIHAAGLETGVLSNTNHMHWETLAPAVVDGAGAGESGAPRYPTVGMVRHLHASHLLGASKPDAAIYRIFEERAGYAGRGGEILFFDDLAENVEAARAIGWRAEQVDHTGDTAAQMRGFLRSHGVGV